MSAKIEALKIKLTSSLLSRAAHAMEAMFSGIASLTDYTTHFLIPWCPYLRSVSFVLLIGTTGIIQTESCRRKGELLKRDRETKDRWSSYLKIIYRKSSRQG
ncbi:MAG: hypothetical protein WBB65_01030 [Anaerolineales bacterium]